MVQLLQEVAPEATWYLPATQRVHVACIVKSLNVPGAQGVSAEDPTGQKVRSVTSVHQQGRRLYLGNLMGSGISFVELADGE